MLDCNQKFSDEIGDFSFAVPGFGSLLLSGFGVFANFGPHLRVLVRPKVALLQNSTRVANLSVIPILP